MQKHLISDSDTPNRGISTGKRRKAATKEKESSQLTVPLTFHFAL